MGIREEASFDSDGKRGLEFRTYPRLGEGEEEAFEAAMPGEGGRHYYFPSRPQKLRPAIRRASRARIPVCASRPMRQQRKIGIVAMDTLASGSIAADLMGRFLDGRQGSVAVTLFEMAITEHAEKYAAFESTLKSVLSEMKLMRPIEDHDVEKEAYGSAGNFLRSIRTWREFM